MKDEIKLRCRESDDDHVVFIQREDKAVDVDCYRKCDGRLITVRLAPKCAKYLRNWLNEKYPNVEDDCNSDEEFDCQ